MGGTECGDIMGLTGANVDLQSPNGPDGMGNFCPQTGSFTSLASVPTDYSACAWTPYVEGIVGLADTARELGFAGVMSGPLVRSSYRAGRLYEQAVAARQTNSATSGS